MSLEEEALDYVVTDVEGEIPSQLRGVYYRNGPGTFEAGSEMYAHPFDGDGLVLSLSFPGNAGRPRVRARYVDTPERRAERSAGRVLYRNTFGTQRSGGAVSNALDVTQKNVSNTSVLFWAGRLWSLWEALQPFRLEPTSLETLGMDDLEGTLQMGLPFGTGVEPIDALLRRAGTGLAGDAFSAHPHVEGSTGKLVTFSYRIRLAQSLEHGPLQTVIRLLEFEPGSVHPVSTREVPLHGYGFCHDFCFTATHVVLFQSPVDLDLVPFVSGAKCPGECLSFRNDRPTKAFVVPRGDTSAPVVVHELPPAFVFHHANAYDDESTGNIVVDSVHMGGLYLGMSPGADFRKVDFEKAFPYRLHRTILPTSRSSAATKASSSQVSARIVEFPHVAPSRFGSAARYVYCACITHPTRVQPLQAWVKLDMADTDGLARGDVRSTVWAPGRHFYVGEPQFVPAVATGAGDEDAGWLIGWVYDAQRRVSAFAILDARTMTQVAMLRLKHAVPYGLHGTWVDSRE